MPGKLVLEALRHVWLTLRSAGIPAAVMGGLALATWKHVRATKDVDLLLGISRRDAERLLPQLAAAKILLIDDMPWTSLGRLAVLRLQYEPPESFVGIEVDLLAGESDFHRQAIERRVATRLPDLGIQVDVLTCEDLVLHKLLAGRMIDRADSAALLRLNRETLDFSYLLRHGAELSLEPEIVSVWREAFPGEPLPSS